MEKGREGELLKDLNIAIALELPVKPDDSGVLWAVTRSGETMTEVNLLNIATHLDALGYVKVVRCGECVEWKENTCMIRGWKYEYTHHCQKYGWGKKPDDYCSAGERVVAKDATGEEGKE